MMKFAATSSFVVLCAGFALSQTLPASLVDTAGSLWPHWDKNHDGKLDRREIVTTLRNPAVRGLDATIAANLYQNRYLFSDAAKPFFVTREEMLALAAEPGFAKSVQRGLARLARTSSTLFAEGDPKLTGFHQGRAGDCYLLSNLAMLVLQRPELIRAMYTTLGNGDIRVTLGDGQTATVSPMTDGEVLLGADTGAGSGVWLPVFEKAYGLIRQQEAERAAAKNPKGVPHALANRYDEEMYSVLISSGASVATLQELTGHKVIGDAVLFGKEASEQQKKLEETHALLVRLMKEKRLVLLHTRRNPDKGPGFVMPPGWPDAHTFGMPGYDGATRTAHCFNPWGNNIKPKGAPGLVNGYPTANGHFDVPLAELMALYKSLSYETGEPLVRSVRN